MTSGSQRQQTSKLSESYPAIVELSCPRQDAPKRRNSEDDIEVRDM